MKRREHFLRILMLTSVLALPWVPLGADDDEDDDDRYVSNEIVVKLDPATGTSIEAIHASYGTVTLSKVLESASIYLIRMPDGANLEVLVEELEDDPRLLYAEPNYITSVPQSDGHVIWAWSGGAPQLGAYPEEIITQTPTQLLDLPSVRGLSTGAGVVVAVLDTGIDFAHPNFVDRILQAGYDYVDDDTLPADRRMGLDVDADGRVDENFGHGTHVAGIVLLAAPDARILPLRVLDSEGRGNVFTLVEAIAHAVREGAQVINLSLGTDFYSDLLEEAIEDAVEEGVLVVAAAGNANSQVPRYPAADDEVIGVASVDANDIKSPFTNWGPWVDVAAPGEALISAFPGNAYSAWSGTSMAAPLVAGQAALLKAMDPSLMQWDLLNIITRTTFNIDAINPGWAQQLGAGRIDLMASLQEASRGGVDTDLTAAIERLQAGWDEAYVAVQGILIGRLDEEAWRFAVGDLEVILETGDDGPALSEGATIVVRGELEIADEEDRAEGFLYELYALSIQDAEDGSSGGGEGTPGWQETPRTGTLAEMVSLFEARGNDDLLVRVTGTLGEHLLSEADDDDDYFFSDGSGTTVVLDLDSRTDLSFAFAHGIQIEVTGRLERIEDDHAVGVGVLYELDALSIRLADNYSLDVGQLSPLSGSTITDWIGYFWKVDDDGWYYHPVKGFLYGGDVFGDNDWFFANRVADWIYASRELYPFIYSNLGGWHYLIGSPYTGLQHAYQYDSGEWIWDFWN